MNSKNYHQKKRFGQHWLVNKKILEKIKEIALLNKNSRKANLSKKLTSEEELYDEFNYLLDE